MPVFGPIGTLVCSASGCTCTGGSGTTCSPCTIPNENLTISWVNLLVGNGSDTLVYSAGTWSTGCSGGAGTGNQLIFTLFCTSGSIEFRVYYFISGSCPTGQITYCSNLLASPRKLTLASYTCGAGFTLVFTETSLSCPAVTGSGFTSFTITL